MGVSGVIPHIQWPLPQGKELGSPFLRGEHERPLRLTLFSESLVSMPRKEAEALTALRDVAQLPHMAVVDTSQGDLPRLTIDHTYDVPDNLLALVMHGQAVVRYGYWSHIDEVPALTTRLSGEEDVNHPRFR